MVGSIHKFPDENTRIIPMQRVRDSGHQYIEWCSGRKQVEIVAVDLDHITTPLSAIDLPVEPIDLIYDRRHGLAVYCRGDTIYFTTLLPREGEDPVQMEQKANIAPGSRITRLSTSSSGDFILGMGATMEGFPLVVLYPGVSQGEEHSLVLVSDNDGNEDSHTLVTGIVGRYGSQALPRQSTLQITVLTAVNLPDAVYIRGMILYDNNTIACSSMTRLPDATSVKYIAQSRDCFVIIVQATCKDMRTGAIYDAFFQLNSNLDIVAVVPVSCPDIRPELCSISDTGGFITGLCKQEDVWMKFSINFIASSWECTRNTYGIAEDKEVVQYIEMPFPLPNKSLAMYTTSTSMHIFDVE